MDAGDVLHGAIPPPGVFEPLDDPLALDEAQDQAHAVGLRSTTRNAVGRPLTRAESRRWLRGHAVSVPGRAPSHSILLRKWHRKDC